MKNYKCLSLEELKYTVGAGYMVKLGREKLTIFWWIPAVDSHPSRPLPLRTGMLVLHLVVVFK